MSEADGTDQTLEQDVDAIERQVFGATQDQVRQHPDGDEDSTSSPTTDPATFAIDLEPEDQGTAGAAGEGTG